MQMQVPLRTSLTDWYDTVILIYCWFLLGTKLMVPVLLVVIIRCGLTLPLLHMVMDSMETLVINSSMPTVYGYKTGINFWILPPGVPDF